jgi:hypothetical protein
MFNWMMMFWFSIVSSSDVLQSIASRWLTDNEEESGWRSTARGECQPKCYEIRENFLAILMFWGKI